MKWETVIGLEVHTQLSTRSKIFSGASTAFGAEPNTQACGVDIALPGVLPVMNQGAAERAIRFGLAIGAGINKRSVFARKNYFYPDLPKGYQISQYELPIVEKGELTIRVGDTDKIIRITRAHLEEDAGKSLHEDFHGMTGIDLNRAGTPLLEIVSEPDMRSADEAVAYARTLHTLVTWIGICDGNMQEGSFRVDANVSVRPTGQAEFGTRCEIKNLNSFGFLKKAIEYEARRQIELIEDGGTVRQETRLYDPDRDETRTMRSKEDAHDYRYFPDPDLPPLVLNDDWIEQVRAGLPELPASKQARYMGELGLTAYDASVLTGSKDLADFFEAVIAQGAQAKPTANWVMGELAGALNKAERGIIDSPVTPAQLALLVRRIEDGTLSSKTAKQVFEGLWHQEGEVDAIIEARGLKQMSDSGELEKIVSEVLAANPKSVEEYRAGKDKAFNALVGQVMKQTRGKANPQQVNDILKTKLGS
ncbi:MAG TPA: Asp-tRNA(Asn)/Glu-tRNA(Gln) amidotransferase subunit GatB [Thiobacillaceae bacterium]|nr:Asp-tRNA(Asn)/Glu-tRNA(Gln) amidotransferase subunit GatB [Thiobacillaceae bacterium]